MRKFWAGADPGGTGNFGLAFLDGASGDVSCQRVSSVDEAVAADAPGQPLEPNDLAVVLDALPARPLPRAVRTPRTRVRRG